MQNNVTVVFLDHGRQFFQLNEARINIEVPFKEFKLSNFTVKTLKCNPAYVIILFEKAGTAAAVKSLLYLGLTLNLYTNIM